MVVFSTGPLLSCIIKMDQKKWTVKCAQRVVRKLFTDDNICVWTAHKEDF